jgi:corrinoid protein of di/trimethylamine methyltransferase
MDSDLEKMTNAVVVGDLKNCKNYTSELLNAGRTANQILDAMSDGMTIVGDKYAKGQYYLPQVLLSAEVFNRSLVILTPELKKSSNGHSSKGRAVVGCCEGDVHEIGKKLVATLTGAAGFEVFDLGKDVKLELFVDTAQEKNADIIMMSALMTTTMEGMKTVVDLLNQRGMKGKVKTIIGGAHTKEYAEKIGADAYGESAAKGAELATLLAGKH